MKSFNGASECKTQPQRILEMRRMSDTDGSPPERFTASRMSLMRPIGTKLMSISIAVALHYDRGIGGAPREEKYVVCNSRFRGQIALLRNNRNEIDVGHRAADAQRDRPADDNSQERRRKRQICSGAKSTVPRRSSRGIERIHLSDRHSWRLCFRFCRAGLMSWLRLGDELHGPFEPERYGSIFPLPVKGRRSMRTMCRGIM